MTIISRWFIFSGVKKLAQVVTVHDEPVYGNECVCAFLRKGVGYLSLFDVTEQLLFSSTSTSVSAILSLYVFYFVFIFYKKLRCASLLNGTIEHNIVWNPRQRDHIKMLLLDVRELYIKTVSRLISDSEDTQGPAKSQINFLRCGESITKAWLP